MKGKIITYTEHLTEWNKVSFTAIVIDHRDGYTVRKTWSKGRFIDCPLVKLYWLHEPTIKPPSALRRMSVDWNMDPQYDFGFIDNTNNIIIDGWDEFKSEWYYLDIFEVGE